MTKSIGSGRSPAEWPKRLLTRWADNELARLTGMLRAKEAEIGVQLGQPHPQTWPIYRHILLFGAAFDPKFKRVSGRLRVLLVLWDHGRKDGTWISLKTICDEAGFADRNNACDAANDLVRAGIVTKDLRPGKTCVYRFAREINEANRDKLIELAFYAATGALALYVLVLRAFEISVGFLDLTRKRIHKALAEGVVDSNGIPAIDRRLSDERITECFGALLARGLVVKILNGRLTIPEAVHENVAIQYEATLVWDRVSKASSRKSGSKKRTVGSNSVGKFPSICGLNDTEFKPTVQEDSTEFEPTVVTEFEPTEPPHFTKPPLTIQYSLPSVLKQQTVHLRPDAASDTSSALRVEAERDAGGEGALVTVVSSSLATSSDEIEVWRREVRAAGDDHEEGYRRLAAVVPVGVLAKRIGVAVGSAMPDGKRWHQQAARSFGVHKLRTALLNGADDNWLVDAVQRIGEEALKSGTPLPTWKAVSHRLDPFLAQLGAHQ